MQILDATSPDGTQQGDRKPREMVTADAELDAGADHAGQFIDFHEAWPVGFDQREIHSGAASMR